MNHLPTVYQHPLNLNYSPDFFNYQEFRYKNVPIRQKFNSDIDRTNFDTNMNENWCKTCNACTQSNEHYENSNNCGNNPDCWIDQGTGLPVGTDKHCCVQCDSNSDSLDNSAAGCCSKSKNTASCIKNCIPGAAYPGGSVPSSGEGSGYCGPESGKVQASEQLCCKQCPDGFMDCTPNCRGAFCPPP